MVALAACGSDAVVKPAPADDEPDASAQCAPTTEAFAVGETIGLTTSDPKTGMQARIVMADHNPPAYDYNTWTLAVTDASGAPMPDAHITWACAWMPAHLHGSNPREIDELGNGRFTLGKQNLTMYGEWQVKLWVSNDPAAKPYAPQVGAGNRTGDACSPSDLTTGVANIVYDVCVPRDRDGS
jgi:YtkA-like